MDNSTIIILLVILVMLSAFFSATETAFSSLNKIKLKNLANNGNKRAAQTYDVAERYSTLLSTILVGNNIVNILASSLATVVFVEIVGQELGVTYSTIVMTIIVLIFGEITPKSIAKEVPEKFAMAVTPVISFLMVCFRPVTFIFDSLKHFLSLFIKVKNDDEGFSSDEFITIVEEAHQDGGMDEREADLLTNAIEFTELDVYDILTPRVDVVAVDVEDSIEEVERLYRETGFSRLPVYRDTIDNIIGVLHEKDFYHLYYAQSGKKNLESIVKNVLYTSPHVKVPSLLHQLQSSKLHLAVVIDEYGGTSGIITMEDILEELVGEIYDEHDEVEEYFQKVNDTTFMIKGDAEIDDMFDYLGLNENDDFDFNTVSGWVIDNLDCIPKIGQEFDYKNLHITVTNADPKTVEEVKVEVLPSKDDKEDNHFLNHKHHEE